MIHFRQLHRLAGQASLSRIAGACGWRGVTLVILCLAVDSVLPARAADQPAEPLSPASVAEDRLASSNWRMVQVPPDATNGLGSWIWSAHTSDKQICQMWHGIEIPRNAKVTNAVVRVTADNGYLLLLDGREVGQGTDWRALTEYNLTQLLSPGRHALAIVAFNDFLEGGVIFGMRVEMSDGRTIHIRSDESWRIAPNGEAGWKTKTQAPARWAHARTVEVSRQGQPGSSLWWVDKPVDYVVVPPLEPLVIPFWQRGWFHVGFAVVLGTVLLVCVWLVTQLIIHKKERRLVELERSRIARDIHDDIGTRLTKLVLQGEIAQNKLPVESPLAPQLDRICEGLRDVLGAMDEVLWAVNPRHDTLANYVAYICDYAQEFMRNTGMQCLLDVEHDLPPLNLDLSLRRSLVLVVKEALNNAAKHSGATQVKLKIHRSGPKLVVVVEDNGCGFDLNQAARTDRNGLKNFSERMREASGDCRIVARPGEGCRVEFAIPLARRQTRGGFISRRRQSQPRRPCAQTEAWRKAEPTPSKSPSV